MQQNMMQETEKYRVLHQKKKRLAPLLTGLAVLIAGCTAYALSRPALAREIVCTLPEHIHTDACYTQLAQTEETVPTCSLTSLGVHRHTSDCYDDGGLVCGYADFVIHHHDETCYTEDGTLWCPLPEVPVHQHTAACYRVEESSAPEAEEPENWDEAAGDGFTEDADRDFVTEADGSFTGRMIAAFDAEENSADQTETRQVLICGMQETAPHRHTDDCFDADGNWICGKLQIIRHQHDETCYAEKTLSAGSAPLTCTNTDEAHVHGPRCYGTWVLSCGMEEHTHTESCFSSAEDPAADGDTPDAADETAAAEKGSAANGTLNISLLYGDEKTQEQYPDGVFYYTHTNMSGYLKLEPSLLENDLTDETVTLSIPKQYVEKDSVSIPKFNTNSSSTQYEILPVEENEENYYARIYFAVYDKTQTLVLPFVLSFEDDVVPDNYELPVTASVSGGETTDPNIYRPLYKQWGIDKYVNSNRYQEFKKDGAEVVVTPLEEGGNPYLDDLTYVDFAFIVNGCTYAGADLRDWRDVCEVTLTDVLPKYTDKDGNTRIAVFDADVNPGWTLSDDKTTVSKTYTGTKSGDVLTQIYNDELHLRFPGLRFKKAEDGDLIADLDNSVHLDAIPSNAAEGETQPEADDSLRFRMTNDPGTGGRFSKWATKGDIYDVDSYKTNPYPWRVELCNEKTNPLQHIKIQDRKIAEDGETVLKGLDEALKFVQLESDRYSVLADGQTYADIIDRIVAYYTDGTTQDYMITQNDLNAYGDFTITFDEDKVCDGYEILFRDDYEMQHGEKVSFTVYTVYRDPDHTHVPDGMQKVAYTNEARSINSYQSGDETVSVYLKAQYSYDMLPSTEKLAVKKQTLCNDGSQTWDGAGGNTVGSTYIYLLKLSGSLLEPEVKEYQDIRVVDLLPDGVHYEKIHLVQQDFSVGSILDGGRDYQPEVIENYHNSGRTAVIFHLNTENLRKTVGTQADIYFGVTIDQDARPGTVRNDVYVVGDNLDEYQEKTGGAEDIYDLNNNGRTDDRIAWSFSDATIIAAHSTYAEKYIAPAGSENWSKQGLLLKAGAEFDYLLKVTNEMANDYTGLTVYDTLPRIGDQTIFGAAGRGSEFSVQLRGAITPPAGYTVYYTTSPSVYESSMQDAVDAAIWTTDVSDYADVTAFKLAAQDGTVFAGESVFQVQIPVRVPDTFDEASLELLHGKEEADQLSGTASWLEAINSFGCRTDQWSEKESNTVWARVPFAGFCVKKVDGIRDTAIEGAEFTLTDETGAVVGSAVSDAQGCFRFRELTEGTYTLTETKVPEGYMDRKTSITVSITQNPVTMEYSVTFDGAHTGAGTERDPLRVENYSSYALPQTGGGALLFALGAALAFCTAAVLLIRKRTGKSHA